MVKSLIKSYEVIWHWSKLRYGFFKYIIVKKWNKDWIQFRKLNIMYMYFLLWKQLVSNFIVFCKTAGFSIVLSYVETASFPIVLSSVETTDFLRETIPSQTSDMGNKTVSVLAPSLLLPLRANSVYILSITHLRYSRN